MSCSLTTKVNGKTLTLTKSRKYVKNFHRNEGSWVTVTSTGYATLVKRKVKGMDLTLTTIGSALSFMM